MRDNNSNVFLQSNLTIELVDIYQCCFSDFPESGIDCSRSYPKICLKCEIQGRYFNGEGIDEYSGYGHLLCRILAVVCAIFGIVGILSNAVIVIILQRRHNNKSYDLLLTFLAYADLLCCLTSISGSISIISFFGKLLSYPNSTFKNLKAYI